LFLTAGNGRCLTVEYAGEFERFGNREGVLAERGLAPANAWESGNGPAQALAGLLRAIQEQGLQHGELGKAAGDLEGAHHAVAGEAVGPPAGDVAAFEPDAPGVRRDQARDDVEQCGFAGAVRA